jgi:hypothetical protein
MCSVVKSVEGRSQSHDVAVGEAPNREVKRLIAWELRLRPLGAGRTPAEWVGEQIRLF